MRVGRKKGYGGDESKGLGKLVFQAHGEVVVGTRMQALVWDAEDVAALGRRGPLSMHSPSRPELRRAVVARKVAKSRAQTKLRMAVGAAAG